MAEIYLLRHGETEWSREGRHTSFTDLPLTPDGEVQAGALVDRLSGIDFDQVLVSPRLRARRTAELAGLTGTVSEDLVEWDYGDYEGITSAQIHVHDPGWVIWTGRTPGGETPEQVRIRCRRLIEQVESSGAQRVALVAHGHILRALTLVWLDLDFADGEKFPLDTGAISVLGHNRGELAMLRWNS